MLANYEIQEFIFHLLSLIIIQSELFKREGKFRLAYLHLKMGYQIGKIIINTRVFFF